MDLSPEELAVVKHFYVKLAKLAENDDDVHTSHSLDEADDRHKIKLASAGGAATTAGPVGPAGRLQPTTARQATNTAMSWRVMTCTGEDRDQ